MCPSLSNDTVPTLLIVKTRNGGEAFLTSCHTVRCLRTSFTPAQHTHDNKSQKRGPFSDWKILRPSMWAQPSTPYKFSVFTLDRVFDLSPCFFFVNQFPQQQKTRHTEDSSRRVTCPQGRVGSTSIWKMKKSFEKKKKQYHEMFLF